MLTGNFFFLCFGFLLAVALILLGGTIGYRQANRRHPVIAMPTDFDRQTLVNLLKELGAWTTEYSGNVSQFQTRISEFADSAKRTLGKATPLDRAVAELLGDIMRSNTRLKERLDAAERQLDKQTRQIESYLSEARTDGLTGLANRRAFDTRIDELFAAYRKGGKSFVMVMLDIDHFKQFNDTHGHQLGDEVLRQVASILKSSFDGAYLVARYGGEEFALLLPSPLRLAADRVDVIRRKLADESLELGGEPLRVTVSAGLSEPREELAVGKLIRRADEALYAAKKIGRNRVYYHDGKQTLLVGAPELVNRDSLT